MVKRIFNLLILGVALLPLFATPALAGSAKVFLFHSKIGSANLGAIDALAVTVYAGGTDQTGAGTKLTANVDYTVNKSAKYQGTEDSYLVDITKCNAGSASILLIGNNRYAIVDASTPDIPGPDQTPSIKSYKLGKPTPPIVADDGIKAGFETAKVSWTLDPEYNYDKIFFKLSAKKDLTNPIKSNPLFDYTTVSNGAYAFGEYVDNRKLDPGATYFIGLWGTVAGVAPSDYSTNADSVSLGLNVLIFKTKAGGGSGSGEATWNFYKKANLAINQHELTIDPVAKVIKNNGNANTIKTVADLVKAINDYAAAQTIPVDKAVTAIGWWDSKGAEQKMQGYTITYPGGIATYTASDGLGAPSTVDLELKTYQFSVAGDIYDFKLTAQ